MPLSLIERIATLYFFYPFNKINMNLHNRAKIPILMYHSISNDREHGIPKYYRISTSPVTFENHMRFIYDNKYSVIDLHDIRKYLDLRKPTKDKVVILTFDDGYHDFYTEAYPILKKFGFTATVFLPTSFIDSTDAKLKEKGHLNWHEVRELSKCGITFGSHTVTHPKVKFLENEDIEYELKKSKEIIEDNIGKSINSFSYPYAFPEENKEFKKRLIQILHKCEYELGVTTIIGTYQSQEDILFMKRLPVNEFDDTALLKAKLEGAYDWMHVLQLIYKHIKNKITSLTKNHRLSK